MNRSLVGKRPTFHRSQQRSNSYRMMLWLVLIMGGLWLMLQVQSGEVEPLFSPTPTPTRVFHSYVQEAQAYFEAGKIDDPNSENDAIDTYRLALQVDPDNAEIWAELARIQTYSSSLLPTRDQVVVRLGEALEAIDNAIELDPDSSNAHAIRAFVLDWSAPYGEETRDRDRLLTEALNSATRAIQLDPDNGMALAFLAEVQLDNQKWSEAQRYAEIAIQISPDSMDARRVYARVLESLGAYRRAIEEYQAAVDINPNLTFLYIKIGVNFRHLEVYDRALEYFDMAVKINDQLGIKDPLPYIAIAKTYSRTGDFFIAARNAEKAVSLDPQQANTYGQLGIIYFKSRNYEYALPALKCAVESCSAEENELLARLIEENPLWEIELVGVEALPLDNAEIAYYYAVYGQTLAYLSRPRENYCGTALPVLSAVRDKYPDDPSLMSIVNGSEQICRNLASANSP
jgi:tetratricopeptide (TPR) repeat protein